MPHNGFRIRGSETVGQFGFLKLEDLTVETPTGIVNRMAVRHPGAVAVVAVRGADVLLIRQYRAPIDGLLLEIPAGKLDIDGEPAVVAAARELEEEIGYRPGVIDHVADFYTAPGFTDEYMSLYFATDLTEVPHAPVGAEEKAAEIVAVPIAKISALLLSGTVRDAKTFIGLQWLLLQSP